jgi:site-specific DNA-methyltransferase (adenine-specific)
MPNDKGTAARFYLNANWEAEQGEWECVKECPVAGLDEQAGERVSGGKRGGTTYIHALPHYTGEGKQMEHNTYGDSGNASRFYLNADFAAETAERLAQEDPFRYCPKASKGERQKGLDDFYWKRDKDSLSGFVRVSKEEWEALDKRERAQGNIHSTVKPLSLLVWLAKLLAPPPEYAPRRLLVPFAGSGSEVLAAMTSGGWEEVVGVELIQDYVNIANARIARARAEMAQMGLNI